MPLVLKSSESPAVEGMKAEYLLETYRSMEITLERSKRGMAESDVKQEMESFKARLKFHADLAASRDRLRESAGKDRRTQINTMADVERTLVQSMTSLSAKGWQANGRAMQRFLGGLSGQSTPEAYTRGLTALFGSYFEGGGDLSSTDPGLVATMREVKRHIAEQVGTDDADRKHVQESAWVERDKSGKIVGGILYRVGVTDDATIKNVEYLADKSASQENERTRSQVEIGKELDAIRGLKTQVEALPEDADASGLLQKAQASYDKIASGLADDLTGDDAPSMLTRYAEYEGQEKAIKRMEKLADNLAQQIMVGVPSAREQAAQVVMDPNFRKWAAENGYTELGQGTWDGAGRFAGYSPGRDDAKAMLLANWQMRHPSPLIWPKTGKLVEATVQEPDPSEAPYVDPKTGLVSYVVGQDGEWTYLEPNEAKARGKERLGLTELAVSGGAAYLREGDKVRVDDGTGWKYFEGQLPTDLQWAPVGAKGPDGVAKPLHLSEVEALGDGMYQFEPSDMARWDIHTAKPQTVQKVYRGEMTKPRWSPQGYRPGKLLTGDAEGGMLDVGGLRAQGVEVDVVEKGLVPGRTKAKGLASLGGARATARYEKLTQKDAEASAEASVEAPVEAPVEALAEAAPGVARPELPPETYVPEATVAKQTEAEVAAATAAQAAAQAATQVAASAEVTRKRQLAEKVGREDEGRARADAARREVGREKLYALAPGHFPGVLEAKIGGTGAPKAPPSAPKQEKTPEQVQAGPSVGVVFTPEMVARLKDKKDKLKGSLRTLDEGLAPIETSDANAS